MSLVAGRAGELDLTPGRGSRVVEIISPGSEGMDTVTERREYAGAGIPQYWTVDQDPAQTVTMYRLDGDHCAARAPMPLPWALNTSPAEHDLA